MITIVTAKAKPVLFLPRKKLSNFSKNSEWGRDCNNYVAKRYMDSVERKVYFDDVKLQMDAKLWSKRSTPFRMI